MWHLFFVFFFELHYYFVCFSVTLTDLNCQLLPLWKGTWNFWLGAWMIFHQSRTRYCFVFNRWTSLWFSWGLLHYLFVWLSSFLEIQFQYYYRNLSRQQSQQQAWLQKRRLENACFVVHMYIITSCISYDHIFCEPWLFKGSTFSVDYCVPIVHSRSHIVFFVFCAGTGRRTWREKQLVRSHCQKKIRQILSLSLFLSHHDWTAIL